MLIQNQLKGNKGMFYVGEESEPLAEMVYTLESADKMTVHHTEVKDELRGKNVGFQLVEHAVEYARANHRKIVPLCPFTKSVIDKHKEFQDVLV